jgi:hypothetical protein
MKPRTWLLAGLLALFAGAGLADEPPASRPGSKLWPARIPAPPGGSRAPGPWNDPANLTVWPNRTSRSNSDPWLVEYHDKIQRMRPRVLLINFSNEHSIEHLQLLARRIIRCVAEGSRHHGYADGGAPVFLEYQIFKLVDLRDPGGTRGDSHQIPLKKARETTFDVDYGGFLSDAFARRLKVPDPRPGSGKRPLRLDELVDGGYVHEVWFFTSGAEDPQRRIVALEVIELKPRYDDSFHRLGDQYVQAGNGGDPDQPWTGRSLRIGCINASRGPGCFMESLSHGMEGTANSGAIPYFTKYFHEYAGFDLKTRYGLPFESLYAVDYGEQRIRYPDERTMIVPHQGKEYRVRDYVAAGGNVHFPPNARVHYDQDNPAPVLSTIEDWRMGSGADHRDRARPFRAGVLDRYREFAPDCMGPWLVYWRQNMPGRGNRQKDDAGRAMKNWWPFLFY